MTNQEQEVMVIVPDDNATADVVSSLLICFGLVPEC